ncbi:hypothetical protein KJ657_01010 [Patescibacteria group bacterium]|nr:hypothetical protein [Patescibacteria group bacterium]MBU1015648.1 hypothetical protein [Patescibacteria group bacterium]MBU1684777.1 hypothetical protein [Patescibacteria group bacterium]MBU1938211.1 hypothetical protein [Patescibacteria group bacterium]
MSSKSFIWIGMFVGSAIGAYVPSLWGDGAFTFTSAISTAVGGLLGIWVGFKLGNN